MNKFLEKIKNKKIIIATHVYTTGPAQDLKEFLLINQVSKLLFIGHPLFYDPKLDGSGYELYQNGKQVVKRYQRIKKNPLFLEYCRHFIFNLFWVTKSGERWDIFIGNDNLNALSGIILKWLGRVKKTVYYVIDYNPVRFNNKILNRIYHFLDQFCVKYSDETWNLSDVMEETRKKYFGFSGGKQKYAPIGIWFERFRRLPFSKIDKNTLVYMGHITKKQGIKHVIEAIPLIIKKIPNFKFLVIGGDRGSNYINELSQQAHDLGVTNHLKFTGYLEKHQDVEKLLVKGGVAIAMYEKYDDQGNLTFTNFADPGKIKSYLASGLPIILTDVPPNARTLEEKHCAKIVTSDKASIAKAIIAIMVNKLKLAQYRQNAINYAKDYDWNLVFTNNLTEIL